MNRHYLVRCFVSLFLVPVAGVSMSSASEGAAATAAPSADSSDADDVSLPAGVSAEWWAQAQTTIRQSQEPNPDVAAPLRPRASWKAESDQGDAAFGVSVGTAGDVNGDGYDDVIVGARSYDNGETNEGRAFVFYGSASGLSLTPDWTAEGNQAEAYFGAAVGTAGDVNGDGYDDVIVGADHYDNGQPDEGRAFVYYGSASGLSLTPAWTAEGDQALVEFGYSVGRAGDVNGDGYDDVIVSADEYSNGQSDEGRAFVYYGSASGLSSTPDWTAENDQAGANFGSSVGTAGDVNGDGYDDVIIGAIDYNTQGRAYAYYGSPSGLSLAPDWTAMGNQTLAQFGYSVGTAGDVNGDGYDDVIVGAPHYEVNGQRLAGRTFAYYGSALGLSSTPGWTADGNQFDELGNSVGTAGDVNNDGYNEVIVGAWFYKADEGRALIYYGSTSGPSLTPDWTAKSNIRGAYFGSSVGTAGDVNADGYDDVIVGAIGYGHVGGAVLYNGRSQ